LWPLKTISNKLLYLLQGENMTNIIFKSGWNLDFSYSCLPETLFTPTKPTPVAAPELVILNESLAGELDLNVEELQSQQGINILAGNKIIEGSKPLAQAYAGHQFGYFTMLGDGRAILLGEQITKSGERFDIQLKGAGRTPYSRGGDGRAALGPMLREYIISESMHALGIPTTRSLAVIKTGEAVIRETALPGAILVRVAASHIRVGTFQYAAYFARKEDLKILADYTIQRHFPEIQGDPQCYLHLLREVVNKQAKLIAQWQLVGFIHGVMNTDNMSVSGETIDYGPCAFMDEYNPATVFSSIDIEGRYSYKNQPSIAAWNLARFADTLLPLLHKNQREAVRMAEEEIAGFLRLYQAYWLEGMRKKLGIFNEEEGDEKLFYDLLNIMEEYKADFTNTFLGLTFEQYNGSVLFGSAEFVEWQKRWQDRLMRQNQGPEEIRQLMKDNNPALIPRNHRVEEALAAAAQGDYKVMRKLLAALSRPYAHLEMQREYSALPPQRSCPYRTFCGT